MITYTYIDNNAKADDLISRLSAEAPSLYPFDIEATGLNPHTSDLLLIQFQIPHTKEIYVINCITVDYDKVERILMALWKEGRGKLLGHNLKYDLSFLITKFPSIYFHDVRDTFIIEQLITNGVVMKPPSLAELADKYLNIKMDKEVRSSFVGWSGGDFTKDQLDYSAMDVDMLSQIYSLQMKHVRDKELELIVDIECRAVPAFAKMESDGIFVSKKKWDENIQIAKDKRLEILQDLNKYAFEVFPPKPSLFEDDISSINWNSPAQILTLLKKVVSENITDTNEKTIANYNHPLIKLLLEYREQEKIITSYGDSVKAQINTKTGRLHPSFNQLGAKTGRVSCREPNVQQVPKTKIKDENGVTHNIFREAFVPQSDNGYMVGADYSSFELRVLTDLTREPRWIEGYTENADMHSVVASFVFGVPVSKTERPELRDIGKAINFGIAYGMGPTKLANSMTTILKRDVSIKEASDILRKFFKAFPAIKLWQDAYVKQSLMQRCMINPYDGRRLSIEGKDFTSQKVAAAVTNEAKNYPCQSTNATVIKLAMIGIQKHIFFNNCRTKLVNTIHDELLLECADIDEAKVMAPTLQKIMEVSATTFIKSIPVVVEPYYAKYWKK